MIQDLDETIRQILVKRGKLSASDVDIAFDQPTGEWATGLTRPTINCYLYDIRENLELRSRDFKVERQNGTARRVFDPMRIDLSYIITVWTRNIEDEHQLLWRVLQTLAGLRSIPVDQTEGALQRQPYPLPTKAALPSEAIRNLPDLWGVMENQLRPAINYVITLALDLNEVVESPVVTTAGMKVGQSQYPMRMEMQVYDPEGFHVGGRLYSGKAPISGARVIVPGRPPIFSDASGRFVLANLRRGEYEVIVEIEGRKPLTRKITVPAENYDLKLKEGE